MNGEGNQDITRRRKSHEIDVKKGDRHVFFAYGEERAKLALYLFVDGKPVQQVEASSWYPVISYTATKDATVEVFVTGPDEDVSYTFTDYLWRMPKS